MEIKTYTGREWDAIEEKDELRIKAMLSYKPSFLKEGCFYFPLPGPFFSHTYLVGGEINNVIFIKNIPTFVYFKIHKIKKKGDRCKIVLIFDPRKSDLSEIETFPVINKKWKSWEQVEGWFLNGNTFSF